MPISIPLSAHVEIKAWAEMPDDSPHDWNTWVKLVEDAGNVVVQEDRANRRVLILHQEE